MFPPPNASLCYYLAVPHLPLTLSFSLEYELHEAGTTVQYFQRGRLEYHPELPTDQRVVLGLLGDEWLKAKLWLR